MHEGHSSPLHQRRWQDRMRRGWREASPPSRKCRSMARLRLPSLLSDFARSPRSSAPASSCSHPSCQQNWRASERQPSSAWLGSRTFWADFRSCRRRAWWRTPSLLWRRAPTGGCANQSWSSNFRRYRTACDGCLPTAGYRSPTAVEPVMREDPPPHGVWGPAVRAHQTRRIRLRCRRGRPPQCYGRRGSPQHTLPQGLRVFSGTSTPRPTRRSW